MSDAFHEIEKPGDRLTGRQFQDLHLRHLFASRHIQGRRVLDVGCGSGLGLTALASAASSILAIDRDPVAFELASRIKHPRVQVLQADAHHLPCEDHSIDVVLCMAAIMYLDLPPFLSECRRVLVQGGALVGCVANMSAQVFVASAQSRKYYALPELDALLAQHGFSGSYWGVRYGVSDGKRDLGSAAYNFLVPLAMRVINRLPNPRAIKGLLARRLMPTFRLGDRIEIKDMIESEKSSSMSRIDPAGDTNAHDSIYFVATRKIAS
jgi:ubiquinone/menaquinone biosynthesis C-methylase UbiE